MIGLSATERIRLEELLGEPLIDPDPLINIRQAAAILELSVATVRQMLSSGALPRQDSGGGRLSSRAVRLSDVLAWKRSPARISVREAAGILGESISAVHRLTAARLLGWHGGPQPLARREVEILAERRRDWLTLAEASAALRVDPEEVHQLLRSGALTHTADVSRPIDRSELRQPSDDGDSAEMAIVS